MKLKLSVKYLSKWGFACSITSDVYPGLGKAKRKGIREEKREAGERGKARERAQARELSVFSGRIPEA